MERAGEARIDAFGNPVTSRIPDAEFVRLLWRMDSVKREEAWNILGRFQEVVELELGGDERRQCPLDVDELFMFLPEGEGSLSGLRELFLWRCANNTNDAFLQALASAGCGENLTSLTLQCEWLCPFLSIPVLEWEW